MVSKAIADLSESDLIYLEKLLGNEFSKSSNNNESKLILKLINAVRSQRSLLTMPRY